MRMGKSALYEINLRLKRIFSNPFHFHPPSPYSPEFPSVFYSFPNFIPSLPDPTLSLKSMDSYLVPP